MKRLSAIAASLVTLVGCSSMDAAGQRNAEVNKAVAAQTRYMPVLEATFVKAGVTGGTGGSITITGLESFTVSNLLPTLPYPEREKNVVEAVVDGATKIAPYAAAAYLGGKALDNAGSDTTTTTTTTQAAEAATP